MSEARPALFPEVRHGWLLVLAFVVQLAAITVLSDPSAIPAKRAVLAGTNVLVLIGLVSNLRHWSFRILAAGFLLNVIAMAANGGLMPVTPEGYAQATGVAAAEVHVGQSPPGSKNVVLPAGDIKLKPLADTVHLSLPRNNVYSVGDLVLASGVLLFLLAGARAAVVAFAGRTLGPFLPSGWRSALGRRSGTGS